MSLLIRKIWGREVIDSRGNPTIEVELTLSDGSVGRAMVPSGASTGEHEAIELRDEDPKRYLGKGTLKSVQIVNETIAPRLVQKTFTSVGDLDRVMLELDGTVQKSKLGGNSILGVSLAFAHAVALSEKRPLFVAMNEWMGLKSDEMKLPVPLMNILNGGVHANNGLEIQEFMVVPFGFDTFARALQAGVEIFHGLKKTLDGKGLSVAVGDEGGFAPRLESNEQALQLVCEAVEKAGYQLGKQVAVALDVAASSFFNKSHSNYRFRRGKESESSAADMMAYYTKLIDSYPLVSIEDGLDENDWAGWAELTSRLSARVQLVGDDLFVTQAKKVKRGIDGKVANAVLIKVNQVGSLSETFETMNLCRQNGLATVVSHRSGETEDVTIAHLAVGSGSGQIKTGSASRSERLAKYNELLRIEEWAKEHKRVIPLACPF